MTIVFDDDPPTTIYQVLPNLSGAWKYNIERVTPTHVIYAGQAKAQLYIPKGLQISQDQIHIKGIWTDLDTLINALKEREINKHKRTMRRLEQLRTYV